MWKKLLAWILVTVILTGYGIQIVEAFDQKENVRMEEVIEKPDQNSLYAKAAVLMDADSGRILYEKNGHQAMANASRKTNDVMIHSCSTLLVLYR